MGMSLAKSLVASGAGRIVAVADIDEAKRAAAAAELGAAPYPTHTELLGHARVDAVIVAAPPFLHAPIALDAIAAGRHVFVEKPFAVTVADCDAMIAAAEQANVRLMVGQVLRYYPCWRRLREMVADGAVGRPMGVQLTRLGGGWGSTWDTHWRRELAKSGGMLLEINAHEIDFMRVVGGEVERVYGASGNFGNSGCDYANLAYISMHFAGGSLGLLHASQTSAIGDISGKIEGEEGTLFYHDGFSANGVIVHSRHGGKRTEQRVGDHSYPPPVQAEMQEFMSAITEGREPAIPGRDGRQVVSIAQAAYRSAESGRAEPLE
jgi:predicted dehydrogenase